MEDRIAKICCSKYLELGKNGKPKEGEWTLLSGFVVESENEDLKVVSLATGTKCVGKSKMSPVGSVLNDSHSEILSRRGLLRYLFENIRDVQRGIDSPILKRTENGKFSLKNGIHFHFFCSHVPCGDASIIPMLKRKSDIEDVSFEPVKKAKTEENSDNQDLNDVLYQDNNLFYEDIHRTGGKCLDGKDPLGPGPLYHQLGAVRTKPGRGEPTLSLSCSDKIAKWIYCGVQGALLSHLLNDIIHLKSITVGGGGQFCSKAIKRALIDRSNPENQPTIKQSSVVFQHSRYLVGQHSSPCATSIIWIDVKSKPLEVSVDGRRLGVTKKAKDSKIRLKVSKMELFLCFIDLTDDKFVKKNYGQVKSEAKLYYAKVEDFKTHMGSWSSKPDYLLNFFPDI